MLKKIYTKLERLSTTLGIITLFLLAHSVLLIMMLYTFPRINDKFGTQAFDLKTFGYSFSEATMMLKNLDQSTINFYLFPQIFLLDILYPILLALFLSAVIIRLTNSIQYNSKNIFSNLFILPFIAMLFDYFENILISIMITNPTNASFTLIKTASIITQLKSVFTTLSWIVIVILLGIWIKKKWFAKQSQQKI